MTTPALSQAPERPKYTFPPEEGAWVRAEYEKAEVILEYGSGGSTVLAAELGGKTVFSVENDRAWLKMMQAWFEANPPASGNIHMQGAWVGKTKSWGQPVDESGWRQYHRYPLAVWNRDDFIQPDLVLIDGRFRAGCLLATMIMTRKPVTVLFDDYIGRERYAAGLKGFAEPVETRGRMVRFEVEPTPIAPKNLMRIMEVMTRQL